LIKEYYLLTKPGIIYSNVLTAIGGFFLAAKGNISISLLLATVFGLGLVIASACAFNNYIDRDIDAKMSRTKNRALVKKSIPTGNALYFATALGIIGFILLLLFTNFLTAFIAFIGFFFYVIVYTFGKRQSEYGTLIGSVSGAVPPVVGYCAVTGHLDLAAALLFLILVFWQMPHFYAISIFRYDDYASASIPVLPIKKGLKRTKQHMLVYMVLFIFACDLLNLFHYTGITYLFCMTVLGIMWFGIGIRGINRANEKKWARSMFFFSLLLIVGFSSLLVLNNILP
jgi:protoheme IX farnesyltransferase